jgi:hypothetical protein
MNGLKVFIACALGGFIGSLIAFHAGVFWPVGLVVGALVGYISYEFEKIPAAIQQAWNEVIGWRPDWKKIRCVLATGCLGFLGGTCFGMSAIAILSGILCLMEGGVALFLFMFLDSHELLVALSIGFVLASSIGLLIAFFAATTDAERARDENGFSVGLIKYTNPVSAAFWICYGILVLGIWKGVPACARFLWKGARLLSRFAVRAFVLAHSDMRLLCAIDAAIGVYVGYRFGNPIAGGLVGGLWGLVNYYLMKPVAGRLGKFMKVEL